MHQDDEQTRKMTPPQLAAVTAVGASALVFAAKLWLAKVSGTPSVGASAWHVLAGLLYALLMLGILYSPDDDKVEEVEDLTAAEREYMQYQTGLQINVKRSEAMLALVGSLGLLAVAYWVFNSVLASKPQTPHQVTLTLLGLVVVFFVMQFLGRFTYRIGLEHNAPGLVAASFHARTDSFATLLAAFGVITAAMGLSIERFFATLIGLLLVADAAQLFVDATRRLVGLEEDAPTAQLPFWVRLRDAVRIYAEQMPPLVRWVLRYDDALSPEELRHSRRVGLTVALACYLLSGFKMVQVGELGGLKLLGKYTHLVDPGPVYALWPFSSVRIAPVERVQRVTVGFKLKPGVKWYSHADSRPVGEMLWATSSHDDNKLLDINSDESKFMLGDTTQVETHVALTFSVERDGVMRYLFGIEEPSRLVQLALRQSIQEVMGTRSLDDVIVAQRAAVEQQIAEDVQAQLDDLQAGMKVETCMIRSIHPPVEVLDAFVDVASSLEDKERDMNQAMAYSQSTIETAKGEAQRMRNVAEGARVTRVAEARGKTSEFRSILGAVAADPEAVKTRLGLETQERILSTNRKKVILPRQRGGQRPTIWFSTQPPPAASPTPTVGEPQAAPLEASSPEPESGGDSGSAEASGE